MTKSNNHKKEKFKHTGFPVGLKPGQVVPPEQYKFKEEDQGAMMISIPTGRHNICSGTVNSLFQAQGWTHSLCRGVNLYIHAGSLIQIARQETMNIAFKNNIRWLWFIDDDMTFQPDTPARLIKTCLDNDFTMCSALAIKRVPPFSPTVGMSYDKEGQPLLTPETVPSEGIHEIAHSGTACTIIDMQKLRDAGLENEKLFYLAVSEDNKSLIGEDLAFCKELQKHGLKIGLNADLWNGHIGVHTFAPDVWFNHWKKDYIEKVKK